MTNNVREGTKTPVAAFKRRFEEDQAARDRAHFTRKTWRRMEAMQAVATRKALRGCCCWRRRLDRPGSDPSERAETVVIKRKARGRTAYFDGVQTCQSPTACPYCTPRILRRKAAEIEAVLHRHFDAGGDVLAGLFTVPHTGRDRLGDLLGTVLHGYESAVRHSTVRRIFREVGVIGYVRSFHVTYGTANGWHPHVHYLILVQDRLTEAERRKLNRRLFQAYREAVRERGVTGLKRGLARLERVRRRKVDGVGSYLVKVDGDGAATRWTAADELTRQDAKTPDNAGRRHLSGLSYVDLLDRYSRDGQAERWGDRIHEYQTATKGRTVVAWSAGRAFDVRARYGIEAGGDYTEDDAPGTPDEPETVAHVDGRTWRHIVANGLRGRVLQLAPELDPADVRAELDRLRLEAARYDAAERARIDRAARAGPGRYRRTEPEDRDRADECSAGTEAEAPTLWEVAEAETKHIDNG